MSENKSLLTIFSPPRSNIKGQFGLLCGFSASAEFINQALENFTTYSADQRASMGSLNMVMYLDKRADQITSVPGLRHEMFSASNDSFDLMHAKVALLSFAKDRHSKIELIRIVVTTGNWTSHGAITNLDHIWKLDLDIQNPDPDPNAYIEARNVYNFFNELKKYYSSLSLTQSVFNTLDSIIPKYDSDILEKSIFFSSLNKETNLTNNFLGLISKRFTKEAGSKAYNEIICGSGFYEEDTSHGVKVLKAIESELCNSAAFTKNPDAYIVANPQDYEKFLSKNLESLKLNWSVLAFKDPRKKPPLRSFLHSKYIFAGFVNDVNVSHGKIYLGSANLSKKAMLNVIGSSMANIEAGVVVDFPKMEISEAQDRLAISGDDLDDETLQTKASPPISEYTDSETVFASPITAITNFDITTKNGKVHWGNKPSDCHIITSSNLKLQIKAGQESIELTGINLTESQICIIKDNDDTQYIVPIISLEGHYCQRAPEQHDAESILNLLLAFPDSIERSDDDLTENLNTGIILNHINPDASYSKQKSSRTLNLAMELIESIARKNQNLTKDEMMLWFERLEYTLIRCLTKAAKLEFAKIGINILSVLKREHFSPDWQRLVIEEPTKQKYEQIIDKIAHDWEIDKFEPIERLANAN